MSLKISIFKSLDLNQLFITDYTRNHRKYYLTDSDNCSELSRSVWHLENQKFNIIVFFSDFFKGKTVFNHWLPGICYSNITFQLVSEATFNKSTLVEYSGVSHEPKQHRTGKLLEKSNLVKK